MNRRQFVTAAVGTVGVSAGCAEAIRPFDSNTPAGTPPPESPTAAPVTGEDGTPADICGLDTRPGSIPAIIEPAFDTDWDSIRGPGLSDSAPVIGMERAGDARAYPLSILGRHEIVNDVFDIPVLVTFCPLCSSGLTASRLVNGEATLFSNTGFTWIPPEIEGLRAIESDRVFGVSTYVHPRDVSPTYDPNLLMFDEATESFWSQLLARAVCGELTGESLSLVPSRATDWGTWRTDHPETTVLLPPPESVAPRTPR